MTGSVSLAFAGQGAQRAGMGSDFCEAYPVSREIFERASEVLQIDMQELCFTENERLHLTEFTQPAILTVEISIFQALKEAYQLAPKYFAGHSLGEYSALVAAEVIPFEDALVIVRKRGELMQSAVPAGTGGMVAILSEDPFKKSFAVELKECCEIDLANLNSTSQIVISGAKEKLEEAVNHLATHHNDYRVVPLHVSAPFHSSLMSGIEEEFKRFLKQYEARFKAERAKRVLSNYSGDFYLPENLLLNLVSQLSHPVQWVKNMNTLIQHSSNILEISPARVLQPFFATLGVQISSIFSIRSIKKSFLAV